MTYCYWSGTKSILCHLSVLLVSLVLARSAVASDHADPLFLQKLEAGITDLFGFVSEEEQKLTLIVCVRRALTEDGPLPLQPYTYNIFLDLNSKVSFDNREGTLARYGGRVVTPADISEEVVLSIRLHDSPINNERSDSAPGRAEVLEKTLIREVSAEGIDPDKLNIWSGIRDDPFIFYRFAQTNCVAIVIDIPLSELPKNQTDFLIWATSTKRGTQIDHVGRSLRTMLPRLDFLNTLHPKEHVEAIHNRDTNPGVVADIASTMVSPLFGLRSYDFEPDVMILTRRDDIELGGKPYENHYPNGRRLEDDVANYCCEQGDCLLYEVSLAEAHHDGKPRPERNNVDFLDDFPYLADPLEQPVKLEDAELTTRTKIILLAAAVVVAVVLFALIYFTFRYFRLRRKVVEMRSGNASK